VAGERRWRAAQQAGLERVPAVVRELSDRQLAEWALVENLQREDLDPIERARAFQRLVETFHVKHEDLAGRLGIDRSTLANTLRLLELPEPVQAAVQGKRLSAGHARALLALPDDESRIALAERAIAGGWSVRMIEAAVKRAGATAAPTSDKPATQRPAHLADLETQIAQQLNTKVHLKAGRKKGSGMLSISFYSLDEFDALLERLGVRID
jgi:ParB family chromosome partitioning protein